MCMIWDRFAMKASLSDSALVIFISRERIGTCLRTIEAAFTSANGVSSSCSLDLLVNGNDQLASELAHEVHEVFGPNPLIPCRVWSVPLGDKANAWNTYIHKIWCGEGLVFFIDGYVRLRPNALHQLEVSLAENPATLAASGVPTVGRTASRLRNEMLKSGGFHGNLCSLRGSVIDEMRRRTIRIPIGMYRVDSLVGAFLCFGFNPAAYSWDTERIVVAGGASWDIDEKRWWVVSDVHAKIKQIMRQAKGRLENAAVKYFFTILKCQPEDLPQNSARLITAWARDDPQGWKQLIFWHPLAALAWYWQSGPEEVLNSEQVRLLAQWPKTQN